MDYSDLNYGDMNTEIEGEGEYCYGEDEFGRVVKLRKRSLRLPSGAKRNVQAANRIEPLGCNQTTAVAAGVLLLATVQPQRKFKPLRLIVNPNTTTSGTVTETMAASGYLVDDIKIGSVSQLNNDGLISGALFDATAVGTSFSFGTAHVGNVISIKAYHAGANSHALYATFLGKAYFQAEL